MKNLKHIALVFALVLGVFSVSPKKADAIVGVLTGNPTVALIGLAAGAGGSLLFVAGIADEISGNSSHGIVPGLFAAIGGLIMLDGEKGQQIAFESLSQERAAQLKLTKEEEEAYESNLEELSLVSNIVSSKLDQDSTVEESQLLWETYEVLLSEEALSAARKVVSGYRK